MRIIPVVLLAFLGVSRVWSVDHAKFRTCSQTGFCRRHRNKHDKPKYNVLPNSVNVNGIEGVSALLHDETHEAPPLKLALSFYDSGVSRLQVREANPLRERWEANDVLLEENMNPVAAQPSVPADETSESVILEYLPGHTLIMNYAPFSLSLTVEGTKMVEVNSDNLFHFEFQRTREGAPAIAAAEGAAGGDKHHGKKIVGYWEDGLAIYEDGTREEREEDKSEDESSKAEEDGDGFWEEKFGGHTDSKPYGPASVGLDIAFPNAEALYGIPEHASSLKLKTTKGDNAQYSEPYRMYTLDVFEYELDVPMALYGGIPMMVAHSKEQSVGVFWFNPTETFIDVEKKQSGYSSHWISESGIVDLFFLPGPRPKHVISQMTALVGTQELPPLFALGYHQCRWNYKDEKDVATVHEKFEEENIPFDVLWLDIEHTDGKRYFTWDSNAFPTPIQMQEQLSAKGRRMVTIVDPHLKRDNNYYIHKEATEKGLYIKDKDGNDYDGWCWPGASSYLDFTAPHVREWWADQFAVEKYQGSTLDLYTWNDMNEPSVFNGPEVSMQKDVLSLAGIEHREWHNLYGMYQHRATAEGLSKRGDANQRSFVLSRSFYAGSQRWGAIWTGDNTASWEHLRIASPMLLSIGVGGLTFAGADVGGFFGDPEPELLVRWMQAGAYTPFFRGHAHHDSKRREPWVFGEPTTAQIRKAIMSRYSLLPFWYTTFYEAYATGLPTMRPLWLEYPEDAATFDMDDQWLVGSDLLVKPATEPGQTKTSVYLPGAQPWYDVETYRGYSGPSTTAIDTPLEKIAVLQRGGSIIPRKMRLRRSSKLMRHDPYTLVVALGSDGKAEGDLYMDDEETFDFKTSNRFAYRKFAFADGALTSKSLSSEGSFSPDNTIERIIIIGLRGAPQKVTLSAPSSQDLSFEYHKTTGVLTIRKPPVLAARDFTIQLTL